MASPPKIAIICAGSAGLTLARLLHMSEAKVDLTLYERDASPISRPDQGGTLDLHTDTGLAVLRKCGLWDSFRKHARYDGEELIMADKNATELAHRRGGEKSGYDRPEIDRERLKEILLESVPEECVRWGRHLREVTENGMLRFDGREEMEGPFDLVVGADGAWSKVRGRLNGLKPAYSGVSGYEMEIMEPARTCPHVDKMVGRGAFCGISDRKFLNAQRMGNDNIKVRSFFLCPEGEAKEMLDKYGKKGTLEKILERYVDWAPEMTELLRQGDLDGLKHWTLYELPVGCKWEHKKGFTLIGDAASLATPFSGEGVNKAMKDSLELAELIEKSRDPNDDLTLDQAVLLYEQLMFPRAEKIQAMTMNFKQIAFGPDAPIGLMTGMLKTVASDSPSMLMKMLGTAPVLAAVFSYFWIRMQVGWAVRRLWRRT
ncbi:Monooxygenase, FAD-binding [Lasallia pustulata]|uniref:Monooxygenase, FAD-binding n=1 Tax=Lasallia pustulata TaxID=136370 RepID=A0A1W5CZ96_9LECA|nr:Monooxygenase, FAD-binding [Lasallia pustulata]